MSKEELLNTLSRYDSKRKVKKIPKKLLKLGQDKITEIQNISKNELNQVKKFKKKSIDESKEITKLRRIKKTEKFKKGDFIMSLLKSESSVAERNFEKLLNNNNNNNNSNNNNTENHTYDDKIKDKIHDIKMILNKFENIVITKDKKEKDRKEVKKELYKTEKKENLSDKGKKRFMIILLN